MTTRVVMPQAGQDLETGVVRRWLKAEDERVAKGDPLVEVETEKLTLEVEAPAAGVLLRILAPDDTEVPVLSTIAVIGEPGEDIRWHRVRQGGVMRDAIGFAMPESIDFRDFVVATYLYRSDARADILTWQPARSPRSSPPGTWVALDRETHAIRERHAGRVIAAWEVPDHEIAPARWLATSAPGCSRSPTRPITSATRSRSFSPPCTASVPRPTRSSSSTCTFPKSFVRAFAGPKFGIEGIRELVGRRPGVRCCSRS